VPNGSPGTCNGDGDGIPELPLAVSTTGEIFQFWKQLALAGMIEGTYTGIAGSGSVQDSFIGSNVPASRITNTGWSVLGSTSTPGAQMFSGPTYGNYLTFGTKATNAGTGQPALRPEEAWNIDTKMDDGRPSYGKVIAKFWNNQCTAVNSGATAQTNLDASYRLTDTSIQCALHFTQLF
jgi:hypothetical protein